MSEELCYQHTTDLVGALIACQREKGHNGTHATRNVFWTDSLEQVRAENSSLRAELVDARAELAENVGVMNALRRQRDEAQDQLIAQAAVIEAAAALAEHCDRLHPHDVETVRQVTLGTLGTLVTLLDAVAAAVRTETP